MELKDLSNIPFRLSVLETVFPDISGVAWKAKHLERMGDIIRLKRGMYVVSPKVSDEHINEFLVANHLSGPSYVSMATALRYYGLIPEAVYRVTSVSANAAKKFENSIGVFEYIHCADKEYFSIGITSVTEDRAAYLIATPEKALCDMAVFTPNLNLRYINEVRVWLEEDLRLDMDALVQFNVDILRRCAAIGRKKKMINQIIKIIENERDV